MPSRFWTDASGASGRLSPHRTALILAAVAAGAPVAASAQEPEPTQGVALYEIGLGHSGIVFDHVSWLSVGSGGDIVVAEPKLGLVRLIDPETLKETVVGGRGAGPGEFRTPMAVGHVADSIWVWDPGLARLTVFAPDLELIRTQRLPFVGAPAAPLLGGGAVGPVLTADGGREALRRLLVVGSAGVSVRDSVELGTGPPALVLESRGVRNQVWQPWSDHPLWVPAPNGDGFVVVNRRTSGPPVAHVRRYDSVGAESWTTTLSYTPMTITREHVRAMADQISSGSRDFARRHGIPIDAADFARSAVQRQLHVPDRFPPVSAAALGAAGQVYLRGPVPPNSRYATYWILAPNGQLQGNVRLPEDFRLFHAEGRSVWGTRTGPDGQVFIAAYLIPDG